MPVPEESATGGADTRTCPFCAETIKAAAIKCRYCHSDLTPSAESARLDTPPPVESAQTDTTPVAEPVETPRWVLPVAAVMVVATLVLGFLTWRAWDKANELEEAESSARAVRATVAERVEQLLSYDHTTFDEDLAAAEEAMTADFRDEYAPTVEEIRATAVQQKRTQEARVVAVSVIDAEPDEVHTLLFVDTYSSRTGEDGQDIMQNRVDVTMVREGGKWLIDDVSVPVS